MKDDFFSPSCNMFVQIADRRKPISYRNAAGEMQ